jgi:hypothetical protein
VKVSKKFARRASEGRVCRGLDRPCPQGGWIMVRAALEGFHRLADAGGLGVWIACFSAVACCFEVAKAETITVCPSGCQFSNLASAINASVNGDVIEVAAGTYPVWSTLSTNGKAITIRGAVDSQGSPITVLDGQDQRRVLQCRNGEGPGTIFQNLVIQNGRSSDGAGCYIENASPKIINCHIRQNRATFSVGGGGGLYLLNSSAVVSDCLISNNESQYRGGGIILWNSSASVSRCVIEDNYSVGGGGGVCVSGAAPVFELCRIWGNYCANDGGGLFLLGDGSRFTECDIRENIASVGGGFACRFSSVAALIDCVIDANNASSNGGGASITDSSPSFLRCAVRLNNGGSFGGGLSIAGASSRPTLQSTSVCGNVAATGSQVGAYQGTWDDLGGSCVVNECINCADSDGDGAGDLVDNCPSVPNSDQADCDQDGVGDACDSGGDVNQNGIPDNCECIGDFFPDGAVDGVDLGVLLAYWGPTTSSAASQLCDINRDGSVDGNDLGQLLSRWGACSN